MSISQVDFPLLNDVKAGLAFDTVDELSKLLALLPIAPKTTRKAEYIEAISQYLLGPGLKTQWNELDPLQQAAVAEAAYSPDGRYQAELFEAKYGERPNWPSRNSYSYREPAAGLDLFFYRLRNYGSREVLPKDLGQKLKQFVPPPEPFRLSICDDLPDTVELVRKQFDFGQRKQVTTRQAIPIQNRAMEQAAIQDLNALLRLIQLGKISVSEKTLMPSKASLAAIAPSLHQGDYYDETNELEDDTSSTIGPIRSFAWVMLIQAGKLASPNGKKLQLTKAGQKALGADPVKTLQTLWSKWQKTTLLDELRRIDNIKGQTGKGKRGLSAPSGRRSQIIEVLSQCPINQWVELDSFMRSMVVNQQVFPVSRHPQNLCLYEQGYGSLGHVGDSWSILQDSYLRCFLFEYAATLGLLDVAYVPPQAAPRKALSHDYWGMDSMTFISRYDGLVHFRLNALGAFCMGLAKQYDPPKVVSKTQLNIQPNGTISNPGPPLSPLETELLTSFAQTNQDGSWRLDRRKALEATTAGQSLDNLYEFLSQAVAEGLPPGTEEFFQDCRQRSESLKDQGLARMIECKTPELAQQIAQDPHLKKSCHLAGDRYLVVPLKQETRFLKALQKLGYSLNLRD